MIAVVCCPTESKLGEVTRSYDESVFHIGYIHDHLSALACLSVFVNYVVIALVVTDIGEMLLYSRPDIYASQRCAKLGAKYFISSRCVK